MQPAGIIPGRESPLTERLSYDALKAVSEIHRTIGQMIYQELGWLQRYCSASCHFPHFEDYRELDYNKMVPPTVAIKIPNGREVRINTGLFINNEWVEAKANQKFASINPA